VLRAEFRVIEGSNLDAEVEGEGEGLGDVDWVLVEDVEVQCSWWMMPFVRGKMEQAHRDICRKVIEKVSMEKQQEAVARTAAKGKQKADSPVSPLHNEEDGERQAEPGAAPDKITYG
jgi:hypothetical protein